MCDDNFFNYNEYPNKLNLGCGFDIIEGYLNIDLHAFHNPDLVGDVCNLSMLPSGYYEEIIAQVILEHLPRCKTKPTLSEWNRLLKPNAILKLRVPNVIGLFSLFLKKEYQKINKQEELIQCCFGTQAYDGDYHFTAFTDLIIKHYLMEAGFYDIKITTKDDWLFEVIALKTDVYSRDALLSIREQKQFLVQAYLSILLREPDDEGFAYYMSLMSVNHDKKEVILNSLLNSDERRNLEKNGLVEDFI